MSNPWQEISRENGDAPTISRLVYVHPCPYGAPTPHRADAQLHWPASTYDCPAAFRETNGKCTRGLPQPAKKPEGQATSPANMGTKRHANIGGPSMSLYITLRTKEDTMTLPGTIAFGLLGSGRKRRREGSRRLRAEQKNEPQVDRPDQT